MLSLKKYKKCNCPTSNIRKYICDVFNTTASRCEYLALPWQVTEMTHSRFGRIRNGGEIMQMPGAK